MGGRPYHNANLGTGGGPAVDNTARTTGADNATAITSLEAAMTTSGIAVTAVQADVATLNVSQTTQDSLIALNATKAEVALIQADNDAQDPFVSFVRRNDGSNIIDWAKESSATGTVDAPTVPTASLGGVSETVGGTEAGNLTVENGNELWFTPDGGTKTRIA